MQWVGANVIRLQVLDTQLLYRGIVMGAEQLSHGRVNVKGVQVSPADADGIKGIFHQFQQNPVDLVAFFTLADVPYEHRGNLLAGTAVHADLPDSFVALLAGNKVDLCALLQSLQNCVGRMLFGEAVKEVN